MKKNILKSPLNYTGGKYKLIDKIEPHFPENISTFVDLFAGGLNVSINMEKAQNIICNDLNNFVIDIYKEFQKHDITYILKYIEKRIIEFDLSKENREAYINFRKFYNENQNPLDLYVLICYSFNYQIRFNSNLKYNNTFGLNRSSFNESTKKNLILFHNKIKNFKFESKNFIEYNFNSLKKGDFVYLDPPYLITTGSYNDGKRGFDGWSKTEEKLLYEKIDELNDRNIDFCLSNVIEHKGKTNEILLNWSKKYKITDLNFNYNNASYQSKNTTEKTREVIITNY